MDIHRGVSQPDPEQLQALIEHQHQVEHQLMAARERERREVLALAPILCSCERRFTPGSASWNGCLVHGEFLILPDGRIL